MVEEAPTNVDLSPKDEVEEKEPLRLVIWPDEFLKMAVPPFSQKQLPSDLVTETAADMVTAMYHYNGIGLAAQQVGVPQQIFVMDSEWVTSEEKNARVFINPGVVDISNEVIAVNKPGEGCLSFPYGYHSQVERASWIELEWFNTQGEHQTEKFHEMESIVIQHELDHLMGLCFIDRISRLKRGMAIRRAQKVRRQYRKGYKRALSSLKNSTRTPEYALKRMQTFEETQRGAERPSNESTERSSEKTVSN